MEVAWSRILIADLTRAPRYDDQRVLLRGEGTVRRLGLALGMFGLGLAAYLLVDSLVRNGVRGWDAITYLAAGERLNAGHRLYALSPGDRWIWIDPPYWTVPLLSPPAIAVLWRPLAALPHEWGIPLWWIASEGALIITVLALFRARPELVGPPVLLLSPAIAWELGVGNVNGFVVAGTVGVWLMARRDHDAAAGCVIAVMAALKVWPVVLLVWFITQARWRAVTAFLACGTACLIVGVLGAGLEDNLDYVAVARDVTPSATSLAGMISALGFHFPWAGYAVLAFGCLEVAALRARPGVSFSVTVGTMVLGCPVLTIASYAVLLAAAAPLAWPTDRAPARWRTPRLFGSRNDRARASSWR